MCLGAAPAVHVLSPGWRASEARVPVVHGPVGLSGFLSSPGAVVLGQRGFCHRSVSPFGSGDQSGFPARCRRGLLPRSLCWALCGGCGLLPSVKFVF